MSTPQTDSNDSQDSENQGENKLGNWFFLNQRVVYFVSLLILVLVGFLVYRKIIDYKDEIRQLEFSRDQAAKNADDEIQRERRRAEEYRKILEKVRSDESTGASAGKNNETPNDTIPNINPKNGVIGLSGGQSGSMTVFVNGGNMNVSEINLGNGAKIDFSGTRWTGSIPTLVTNMLGSSEVGSVTQHKVGPYEDVVFEKTTDIHAAVWISGRVYHEYLATYNVGTTNSPIWVEPTSNEKVAGIRIKSLGPELTVKFTVKKKP